jgi:hypothetical protein
VTVAVKVVELSSLTGLGEAENEEMESAEEEPVTVSRNVTGTELFPEYTVIVTV